MNSTEFKTTLKTIKEDLRGKTLRLITKYSVISYYNLNSFGQAVLEQEKFGQSFSIDGIYTIEGLVRINSIDKILELIKTENVTGVLIQTYYQPKDLNEAMQQFGKLD